MAAILSPCSQPFILKKVCIAAVCCFISIQEIALKGSVYDLVIVNHVMEHLTNGEEVFKKLCNLLQTGGVLYAEFPSIRTAFKKKNGPNYHFHDDLTHISFYVLENLANIALKSGCHIISCGPSTSPPLKYMISIPRGLLNFILGKGFVRFLPSGVKKIDHIFVKKIL